MRYFVVPIYAKLFSPQYLALSEIFLFNYGFYNLSRIIESRTSVGLLLRETI